MLRAHGDHKHRGFLSRAHQMDLCFRPRWELQVGLASGLGQYTKVVREAQKGLKLQNVRFVDAMGLPFQDGHLHLNTQAQVQLGHMLAQSYLTYAQVAVGLTGPEFVV
ncbi:probable carbohydrate esterase At4g34215 [Triticum dicoccoides]|uniref:probable carbohydrate esterase At4g34215 n=1 Tax=Triticum dicoccoides TaxID=85692 RepID=UPI001891DBEF|nr:probable carbohydrate esterase At4g34215 [Triticum dicoccoides]